MEDFLSWLRDNNAIFPKIDFPQVTPLGRGAVALADIATNEVMLQIPFKLMLTPVHAMSDPIIGKIVQNHNESLEGDLMLALYIMYEVSKGESSFYSPYLSIIPYPSSIADWPPDTMQLFQDSMLTHYIRVRNKDLHRMYGLLCGVIEKYPEIFSMETYTFELFKFAYGSIQNRAFGRRLPWSALVPFADCLNHSNVQTKYDYDVDQNQCFRLFPTGTNSYQRGCEVFNSYGRRPNDNLLLDYGFAMIDNEWDTFPISVAVHKHDDEYLEKSKILQSLRMNPVMRVFISRFNLPLDLLTFHRISACSQVEFIHIQENHRLVRQVISISCEIRALALLKGLLQREENKYPTTLEDDESHLTLLLLEKTTSSKELKAACDGDDDKLTSVLMYRVTQKRILHICIQKISYLLGLLTRLLDAEDEDIADCEAVIGTLKEIAGGDSSAANYNHCSSIELCEYLQSLYTVPASVGQEVETTS